MVIVRYLIRSRMESEDMFDIIYGALSARSIGKKNDRGIIVTTESLGYLIADVFGIHNTHYMIAISQAAGRWPYTFVVNDESSS